MNKKIFSALTTAFIFGATSTTFAAMNPFSDVPAGHWAYRSVSKLAGEGIIEGYGDNTFRGKRNITRYEMAQMIARALTKSSTSNMNPASRAELEKLAAEFREELDSLGVRVDELEKNSDKIKFNGILRFDFIRDKAYPWAWLEPNGTSMHDFRKETTNTRTALFRFDVDAEVNQKWHTKARFDATLDLRNDVTSDLNLKRIYADGELGHKTRMKLGKFGVFDSSNLTNGGFIIDSDKLSGAEFVVGSKIKFKLTAGRMNKSYLHLSHGAESNGALYDVIIPKWKPAYYQAAEIYGDAGKWSWALGYHRVVNSMMEKSFGTRKDLIASAGVDYRFDDKLTLGLFHSHSTLPVPNDDYFGDKKEKEGYSVQLTYKKADPQDKGSFGTWLAYRHIGGFSAIAPTFNGVQLGFKGVEFGIDYIPAKNVLTKFVGAWGRTVGSGEITQTARVADRWLGGHAPERYSTHFLIRLEYQF